AGRGGGYAGPDLRVLRYQVATHIAPDLELSGQATVRFRARLSGDRVIMLHLDPRLRLASVSGAGGEPLLYVQNGRLRGPGLAPGGGAAGGRTDRIAVILRAPLRAGQSYALRFQYAGRIITETAGGLFGLTNRMDWYPNRALQPATHDLSFVYPRDLTLVATGRKTAAADAAPAGYQAARWIASRPSDMAGFNLGHFQMAQAMARRGPRVGDAAQRAAGPSPQRPIPIQVYAAPHSATLAHLAAIAQRSAWTVEFYQQRFGPFPYPRLALTELPFSLGQGWPGLIYLAQDAFLTPAEMENHHLPPQAQALYPLMRPHEIAHQWWGNEVAWKSYHDQWLSEALASYAALLDVNAQFRPGALRQVLAYDRTQVLRRNAGGRAVDAAGPLSLGMRLDSARFPHAYATLVYDKGPWVIHMLREMMRLEPLDGPLPAPGPPLLAPASPAAGAAQGATQGGAQGGAAAAGTPPPPDAADARFFGFLRAFAQQYAGRAASTLDFERVAGRFMPPGLKAAGPQGGWHWFFQEWVDGTGIPAYAVDHLQRQGRTLQGILQQSDVPLGFTMPVPLYLAPATGCAKHCRPVYLGSVLSQGPSTEFELKLPRGWPGTAAPEVLIDPYHTILRR
ncbi:MAG: M1 family metallopeptidase, partial [Terriglobales bacterium]